MVARRPALDAPRIDRAAQRQHFMDVLADVSETAGRDDGSLVTRADRAIEAELRARVLERFPHHAVIGEEEGYSPPRRAGGADAPGTARWLLDPIDGTNGFARGMPVWATLIALERAGEVEVGVVSAPALGTRWWAGRGLGAWRAPCGIALAPGGTAASAERLHVSSVARIKEMHLLYGSPRLAEERWPVGFPALLRRVWRARGFGDFWQHCLVAEGAAEAGLEGEIKPWDIAAVQVIVEEAGGRLTGDDGARSIDVPACVSSNGLVHEEVLRVLRGE